MFHASLSNRDFARISAFIRANWGLKMPPAKKRMVESRLIRRLRALNLDTFEDYCEYFFSPQGMEKEMANMVNSVTTNETSFFREPSAFEFLTTRGLAEICENQKGRTLKNVRFWSAGCSSGEEPYSIAICLNEFAIGNPDIKFSFSILATDISTRVLDRAIEAIYPDERAKGIPPSLRPKYLLKNKHQGEKLVRIVPGLRSKVTFRRLNLMEDFRIEKQMDLIFCRNVIIYFDRPTQTNLLRRLCGKLVPGGLLFTGHAETLAGMELPLESVAPMVYRKIN